MKPLAILVPTRSRPHNITRLLDDLHHTDTQAPLILGLDTNDPRLKDYQQLTGHRYWRDTQIFINTTSSIGMVQAINNLITEVKNEYQHFIFLGDDTAPRTQKWDTHILNTLNEIHTGIVYWNDLWHGQEKPTHWAVTGNIVRTWGYFAPPTLRHLYVDDFYQRFGTDIGSYHYLGDVIVEHLHAFYRKSPMDYSYELTNAPDVYKHDKVAFEDFVASKEYARLVAAVKKHQPKGKRK